MQTSRSRWIAAGEAASLVAFAALWVRLVSAHGSLVIEFPVAFAGGLLLGAVAADLASGTVHWLCDRFGSEATPVFGPYLIASFREHHRDPGSIARHGLLERSGANVFAALPVLVAAHAGAGALAGAGAAPAGGAFVLGAGLGLATLTALTNEIHLQAHRARPARWVRPLQQLGLVLDPAEHARHHTGGHDRAYCIATGWSNALLDRLRVFARLERRLGRSR